VDAVVDWYVSGGISGAQRPESEFLRELTSIIATAAHCLLLCLPSVFCQSDIAELRPIKHVCVS